MADKTAQTALNYNPLSAVKDGESVTFTFKDFDETRKSQAGNQLSFAIGEASINGKKEQISVLVLCAKAGVKAKMTVGKEYTVTARLSPRGFIGATIAA